MNLINTTSTKIIRYFIILGSLYLLIDSLLHMAGLRLSDVNNLWPNSSLVYGLFMTQLYGLVTFFIAILFFEIQKNIYLYRKVIILSAFYTLLHGLFLFWNSFMINFNSLYHDTPSIIVWIPDYNLLIKLEASLLIFYSLVVFWTFKAILFKHKI